MAFNLYETGQALTIILIGISTFWIAINVMSSVEVQGGLIGENQQLITLAQDFNVTATSFQIIDNELELGNITAKSAITIPIAFVGVAITAANLVIDLAFILLTGWTVVIASFFEPFGLCCGIGSLGFVIIGIIGGIEVYFLFRLFIIIASVVRGGGG